MRVRNALRIRALALFALLPLGLAFAALGDEPAPAPKRSGDVLVARVDGAINGASAAHVLESIEQAERAGAALLLIELDTPGGRLDFTKDIITAMLNARVPVVVFVSPQGAWAGSAGTFITLAAHVASMAPGTTIGAAHPVFGGPNPLPQRDEKGETQPSDYMMEKAENISAAYIEAIAQERDRNVAWAERAVRKSEAVTSEEALELGVIDLLARDRAELLARLHGMRVKLAGAPIELDTKSGVVREVAPTLMSRVFQVIGEPNVAAILLLAGMALLYFEFNQPGLILPGITGAVLLVLGLLAIQMLPFSWTGLVFGVIGVGLIVAEVFVGAFGVLLLSGLAFLLLGGSMIFDRPDLSDLNIDFWGVLFPAVLGVGLCLGVAILALSGSRRLAQQSGTSELLGMVGVTETALSPTGTVFLRGEYWNAEADEVIEASARVETVAVEGLRLKVKRASD